MTKHTVIAVLESYPGKENELKEALLAVVEPSQGESTNVEYRLHQSTENACQFILYENWTSQAEHLQQFEKPYILDLVDNIKDLLAKPYQAYTANELT